MSDKKEEDWGEFVDPEQMASNFNKGTSFKDIVMMQLKRISEIGSKQLRQGYVERKIINGQVLEKYHEDGRESYCNAIDMMYDLMIGECDRDKNFNEKYEEFVEDERISLEAYKEIKDDSQRLSEWLNYKVKLRRMLLKELLRLLHSSDFLSAKVFTDE